MFKEGRILPVNFNITNLEILKILTREIKSHSLRFDTIYTSNANASNWMPSLQRMKWMHGVALMSDTNTLFIDANDGKDYLRQRVRRAYLLPEVLLHLPFISLNRSLSKVKSVLTSC